VGGGVVAEITISFDMDGGVVAEPVTEVFETTQKHLSATPSKYLYHLY